MKILMNVVLALLLTATMGHAASFSQAWEEKAQDGGGIGFTTPAGYGMGGLGGGYQVMETGAVGFSSGGDNAGFRMDQYQNNFGPYNVTDGQDYFTSDWDQHQRTSGGGSTTGGGAYSYEGFQAQAIGAGGINNEAGTAGAAGSAAGAISAASVQANSAQVEMIHEQEQYGAYSMENVGTYTGGDQQFAGEQYTYTRATVDVDGSANVGSAAGVIQAGGTAGVNDGAGTSMASEGTAAGAAFAIGQDAEAYGGQYHQIRQQNVGSNSYQSSFLEVSTEVQASTP